MNPAPVIFLNLFALLAFVAAIFLVLRRIRTLKGIPLFILLYILCAGAIVSISNLIEWLTVSNPLDIMEEWLIVSLPVALFFFFANLVFRHRTNESASRNQVLAAIHAVTEKEEQISDPFGVIRELAGRVAYLLAFDVAGVFYRRGGENLEMAVEWNADASLHDSLNCIDHSATILAKVLDTGEPLVIEQISNFPDPCLQAMHMRGISSVALFPLSTRFRSLGLIALGSKAPYRFSPEVLDLFKFLGRHLGEILYSNQLQTEVRNRTAELVRALESRALFLSMISHDLRDPLSVIKGSMYILHQYLQKNTNEEVRRAVELASGSARKLERLVGDLLDLVRMDADGVKMEFVPVSTAVELNALAEEARKEAARKGVSLEVMLEENLPPMEVDKVRFQQVMRNLMGNAVKFTPTGGHVTLSARAEADSLIIKVQDSGIGIPPEEIPLIFELFYRGSTAGEAGGSGLGLAIVRQIVRLHGGEIQVESAPGKGSTFIITLPRVHLP